MNNGVKLKVDSRQRQAHVRFGATSDVPTESNFGFDLFQVVEPSDAVSCTAFSVTKIRSSQTKLQYDINDLWSRVLSSINGATPEDTIKTAMVNGLKDLKDINRDYGLKGYYAGHTGSLQDAFANVQSAMELAQSSSMNNTYWYKEWNDTPIFGKMPIGKTPVSTHSYVIVDWKIIDGETVFLIDSHQGQKRYMPRDVFNTAIAKLGCSNLIPSTQEVLDKRTKTILEMIRDTCLNLIIALKTLLILKKKPEITPPPMQTNKIQQWAKAIEKQEGATKASNNPGNLKYASLTASWGATKGRKATDGGYLAQFATYEQGFTALCNFLTLGCHDELKAFHQARTFQRFTDVYAGHPNYGYILAIKKELGCELDTDISSFLS